MNSLVENKSKSCKSKTISLSTISEAFDVVRSHLVSSLGENFEKALQKGLNEDAAYEACSVQRFNTAKVQCMGYMFQRFNDAVNRAPSSLKKVLEDLCMLHGLQTVQDNAGLFLQFGYFNSEHLQTIQSRILDLYQIIRSQAACLVDAFNYSDYIVNSPMGRYDGDIYNQYFAQIKRSSPVGQHPYFERTLKPFFLRPDEISDDHIPLEGEE